MRERVPLVFMTLSVAATLALGGAIAYEFAHQHRTAALQPAATPLQQATGGVKGQTHVASGGPTSGSAASSSGSPIAQKSSSSSSSSGGPAAKSSGSGSRSTGASSAPQVTHHGVITVGGIYDETGPIDATVERDTVRSYFNLVNSQGGVNGYKLQLIDCDSKYDPSSAHQCAQKLLSQGVLAIVGWLSLSGEQNEAKYSDRPRCPDHRRPRRALGVPVAAVVPDDPEPRHHRDSARHARRPGRAQEARSDLPQRQLHPAGRDLVPRRDEEEGHHAGGRRAGRRDEGRLHRHRPQVRGEAARSRWPPSSTRSRTPACSRRWSGRTGTRPSSAAVWTRRRRTSSTTPAADRAARSSAPTPRPRCSSTLDHLSTPAIGSTSAPCTRTTPASTARSTSTPRTSGSPPRSSSRRSRTSGTPPSRARASSTPSTVSGNFNDGGITTPITYGPGNHDPLALPPVDPQHERPVENDVRLELLRMTARVGRLGSAPGLHRHRDHARGHLRARGDRSRPHLSRLGRAQLRAGRGLDVQRLRRVPGLDRHGRSGARRPACRDRRGRRDRLRHRALHDPAAGRAARR